MPNNILCCGLTVYNNVDSLFLSCNDVANLDKGIVTYCVYCLTQLVTYEQFTFPSFEKVLTTLYASVQAFTDDVRSISPSFTRLKHEINFGICELITTSLNNKNIEKHETAVKILLHMLKHNETNWSSAGYVNIFTLVFLNIV